jgi:hypothetical protein
MICYLRINQELLMIKMINYRLIKLKINQEFKMDKMKNNQIMIFKTLV